MRKETEYSLQGNFKLGDMKLCLIFQGSLAPSAEHYRDNKKEKSVLLKAVRKSAGQMISHRGANVKKGAALR